MDEPKPMRELTRIREERGLSQQGLADASGVNKATINQIERGRRSPNLETLEKLAAALEVEIADLFPKAQRPLPLETEPRRAEVTQFRGTGEGTALGFITEEGRFSGQVREPSELVHVLSLVGERLGMILGEFYDLGAYDPESVRPELEVLQRDMCAACDALGQHLGVRHEQ